MRPKQPTLPDHSSEDRALAAWSSARLHIVLSQLPPIILLTASVWLLVDVLPQADLAVRLAFVGILLASGILGSLVQFSAASQGMAAADDLRSAGSRSATARQIIGFRPWLNVVRFVTPAVFLAVFAAELVVVLG